MLKFAFLLLLVVVQAADLTRFFADIASRSKKVTVADAERILAKEYSSLSSDQRAMKPLRLTEAMLGYESKIKMETTFSFSFDSYFHSDRTWEPEVDRSVEALIRKLASDSVVDQMLKSYLDAANGNDPGDEFCPRDCYRRANFSSRLLAPTNVWRCAARTSGTRARSWAGSLFSIFAGEAPEPVALNPMQAQYLHVSIGLLRGMKVSPDLGLPGLRADLQQINTLAQVEHGNKKLVIRFPALGSLEMEIVFPYIQAYPNTDARVLLKNPPKSLLKVDLNRTRITTMVNIVEDVLISDETDSTIKSPERDAPCNLPFTANGINVKAISRELRRTLKLHSSIPANETYWEVSVRDSSMNLWDLTLYNFEEDLPLARDMRRYGIDAIHLEVHFWSDYPNSPPFIRVVHPRFRQFCHGGGGHVTAGGSMCLKPLTVSEDGGWNSKISMVALINEVHNALTEREPPARIESTGKYGSFEALSAYRRVARNNGWPIPKGFGKA